MIFRSNMHTQVSFPDFTLASSKLELVKDFKYLGHMICDTPKDDMDIKRATHNILSVGMSIFRRFYMCSIPVKKRLFTTFCSQIYTAHLWCNYSKSVYDKFATSYNSVLRKLLRVPRYDSSTGKNYSASGLFATNYLGNVNMLIMKQVYGLRCRPLQYQNRLVVAVVSYWKTSKLFAHWGVLLRPP